MAVTDTAVYSWGSNKCGQLGTRTFQDKNKPTEITDLAGKHVTQVACGAAHTVFLCRCACFVRHWCWRLSRRTKKHQPCRRQYSPSEDCPDDC